MEQHRDQTGAAPAEPAGSPAGEIDLGRAPALGRRARLLAGLSTAVLAAVVVVTAAGPDTGTSHSGPHGLI